MTFYEHQFEYLILGQSHWVGYFTAYLCNEKEQCKTGFFLVLTHPFSKFKAWFLEFLFVKKFQNGSISWKLGRINIKSLESSIFRWMQWLHLTCIKAAWLTKKLEKIWIFAWIIFKGAKLFRIRRITPVRAVHTVCCHSVAHW